MGMSMELPNPQLLSVMLNAYRPCSNFGICREAKWDPSRGQLPRGFIGATGKPQDVEVVMVFAEPGHPHYDEGHDPTVDAMGLLTSGMRHVYKCYKSRTDTFHANVRWFMAQLYPDLTFDQQLRRIWLTEGRLCSIDNEIGATKDRTCASHYLVRQLGLLPQATVVAFGGKAQHYLSGLGIARIDAYALAPPGANHRPARPSWQAAIDQIKAKRGSAAH
jgi:hypothetical protein